MASTGDKTAGANTAHAAGTKEGNTAHAAGTKANTPKAAGAESRSWDNETRDRCLIITGKVLFVLAAIWILFLAIGVTALALMAAVSVGAIGSSSGLVAALVVLIITVLLALSATIYANVSVFRNKRRGLTWSSIILIIVVIIQVIILAAALRHNVKDEAKITKALAESFQQSKAHVPKAVKLWDTTQFSLSCCGLFGPDDYYTSQSTFFPPDIPISCCPNFDASRSPLVQEREREICKAQREYYGVGCRNLVIEYFTDLLSSLTYVTAILIIFELVVFFVALFIPKKNLEDAEHKDAERKRNSTHKPEP